MIGPPMSAPARLRSTLRGSVKPELFSRLSMALKLRLLLNSQADPYHLLVPDLVTILNWPPAEWPSSALNIFVTRLKSDTASGITSDVWPVTSTRLSSTPSMLKLFGRGRAPPIEPPSPSTPAPWLVVLGTSKARFRGPPPRPGLGRSVTAFAPKSFESCEVVVCTV